MAAQVLRLVPPIIGEGIRLDIEGVIDEARSAGLTTVAILGETAEGEMWVSGNANAGETLVLMEKAKRVIVFGEDA